MNEDQYWVIVGIVLGLFACAGMFFIFRLIRKDSKLDE